MRRWQQRVYAMLTVFVMLFCSIDFSSLAEKSSGGGYNLPPTICGLEEHEHTDDCYESILICGLEESEAEIVKRYQSNFKVHHHSDQCKDSSGNIACGMIEGLYYHQHNEFCRDEDGNLVCGLETKKPHEHTDECYLQEQKLVCEREETDGHQHGDGCYESRRELICETAEDPGHHHDDSCYTQRKELTCGIEEDAGHHHSEECWQDRKELTCEQEESEEHTHTEECYTIYHDLVCGKEERDGHVHTDDCYTVFNDLTCGEEERDGHSHTDACYRTWDELICEQEEVEAHHHDESCYETVQTLICDKPTTTHHHTAACYNEAGFVTCGKLEVPAFTCSEDNWVEEVVSEGHQHTETCYETQLTCGIPEHTHTDECYPAATEEPTDEPTPEVTEEPTAEPTVTPEETDLPTEEPTAEPTEAPELTDEPTPEATEEPTEEPTPEVTEEPTEEPTVTPEETDLPTVEPTETPAPTEESTPEVTEEPAAEPTETPEETDLPTEEPTAESTETPEPTEEPTNEPVEITIPSAEDAPIQVSITFMSDAGIPEGAELVVTENGGTAENVETPAVRKMAVKAAPMKLASVQAAPEEEQYVTVPSLTTWNIGDDAPEIVLFEKTVDISLVSDGEEIEPNPDAEIVVTAVLPGIEDGQTVEVRHVTENGAVLLESTNNAGVVTFKTNSFSLFTFTSKAQTITSWMTDLTENTFFGKTASQDVNTSAVSVMDVPEGLEVLEAFSVAKSSDLWIVMRYIQELFLGKMESIVLYSVEDGKLGGIVRENITASDLLRFNLADLSCFALVRDSGLRHRIQELDQIILDGMMPKNATVSTEDVSEEYENFQQDETTIAAYDISILNGGEEYQPEGAPVTVTIRDEGIAAAQTEGKTLTLWHVLDDGTAEEIKDFKIEEDTVIFDASGFSIYVVTEALEKIIEIDGFTYRITVTFDKSAGIPEESELDVREVDAADYLPETINTLNWTEQDIVYYQRYLDISIIYDGEPVEPKTPVQVTVELLDVQAGAEALRVVHFGEEGAEEVDSNATEDAVLTFSADSFSVFGFTNALQPVLTQESENADIVLYSFNTELQPDLTYIETEQPEEGLEMFESFSVKEDTDIKATIWMQASLHEDVELDPGESIALYTVKDQVIDEELKADNSYDGQVYPISQEAEGYALVKDTGYRHLTFEISPEVTTGEAVEEENQQSAPVIALDGMMPKAASASAVDVTEGFTDHEYPVYDEQNSDKLNVPEEEQSDSEIQNASQRRITLAAYNISISDNDQDYQPGTDRPIDVKIQDSRIITGGNIELWHIRDDGVEEKVSKFTIENETIEFSACGFSVYTIVQAPDPYAAPAAQHVNTLQELSEKYNEPETGAKGFYLSNNNGSRYCTSNLNDNNCFIEVASIGVASVWYLESANQVNTYYIFTYVNGVKRYMKNKSGNFMELSSEGTAFEFSSPAEQKFYIKHATEKKWLQHSNGGGGIRFYTANDNADNSQFYLTYAYTFTAPEDYYELDGKTFSIAYHEESVKATGLMAQTATIGGKTRFSTSELVVRPNVLDNDGEMLVAKDADLTDWKFTCVSGSTYYITTKIGGETKYLTLKNTGISLESIPNSGSEINVETSTAHKNKYRFKSTDGYELYLVGGKQENGFDCSSSAGDYAWLNLVVRNTEIPDGDFTIYSAEKVNIADVEQVPNGAELVIYTRIWDEDEKRYDFYAINNNGKLIRCYESGDMIQWVGSEVNTALWEFTEYYEDENAIPKVPNYYYELKNTYSGHTITPRIGATPLRDSYQYSDPFERSINLQGRRDGYYYSSIVSWDTSNYAYAAIKIEGKEIVSCGLDQAEPFYFAMIKPFTPEDEVTTVTTVDHTQYGITMKMKNFTSNSNSSSNEMDGYFNERGNVKGIINNQLESNGYPTCAKTGRSLSDFYSGATPVNHLFIKNTYNSSGYFEFDSTQNFATLTETNDGNFTVYKELGTYDGKNNSESRHSLQHGQFLPYNTITPGVYAEVNQYNLYPAVVNNNDNDNELPDSNPRKYEQLYDVEHDEQMVDLHFAMEMEASFVQTPNGYDAWGHDIIYEFTGDDDFWLFVDDELVIDLGGTHSAIAGKVNFCTGDVYVSGLKSKSNYSSDNTTLSNIFYQNYLERNPEDTEGAQNYVDSIFEVNNKGELVFKDYSTHKMRIFFMERGGGASNLHMRFNLASVKPGTILLSKEISGVEDASAFMAEYPFQIKYKQTPEDEERVLKPDNGLGIKVNYYDSIREVPYRAEFVGADGVTYHDVFLLEPGQTAEIYMPDNAILYSVTECCIDTDIYDEIKANDDVLTGTPVVGSDRENFSNVYAATKERTRVTFNNHVSSSVLRTLTIKKLLFDETGSGDLHTSPESFSFRLYLGSENDDAENLKLANMIEYHVKDASGYYCRWDVGHQKFVSTGINSFDALVSSGQKASASFTTSMNGSISGIPVDYTVEIREVVAGTKYKVEERDYEIPDGYSLQKYVLIKTETDTSTAPASVSTTETDFGQTPPVDVIVANVDPHVDIRNLKGWGLRLNKSWTDAAFMEVRDDIFFAVYRKNADDSLDLLDEIDSAKYNTVRRLQMEETSLYWYLNSLPSGTSIDDIVIREVLLTGDYTVSSNGAVYGYSRITPIPVEGPDNKFTISGKQINCDPTEHEYYVTYIKGEITPDSNIRTDEMINSRKGIRIIKEDMEGNPLPNAEFTLKDSQGRNAGAGTYTSAPDGLVGFAYLRENEPYTFTETNAPAGYQAASYHATEDPLTIVWDGNAITVNNGQTSDYYSVNNTATDLIHGTITVRNKKFTLEIKKVDDTEEANPLENVHFALYKQVQGTNGPRKDYRPVPGFEDLVTDENGIVPEIKTSFETGELRAGTYYLYEKEPLSGYLQLSSDVVFTVTPTGAVIVDNALSPSGVALVTEESAMVKYTIVVPNYTFATSDITVHKTVDGTTADIAGKTSFNFTARLYKSNGNDPWSNYNEHGFEDGVLSFALRHNGDQVLTVPVGAVLKISEDQDPKNWYSTRYKVGNGEATVGNALTLVVPSNDETVTFINTRKRVAITVKKVLSDPLTRSGTFTFTGTLTDYGEDASESVIYDGSGNIVDLIHGFDLVFNNNGDRQIVLQIPVGTVFTAEEQLNDDQKTVYDTTIKPTSGSITVANAQTITFTNKRKTKVVTVSKILDDITVSESDPAIFPFTATLYNTDGTTAVKNYDLSGKTNNNGVITFDLSVAHEGTDSRTLTVPYGAVLKVEEGVAPNNHVYGTTIEYAVGEDSSINTATSKTITVTDDAFLAFTNTLVSADVTLTVSKTVEDPDGVSASDEFEFTVSGLDADQDYAYVPQTTSNGTDWTSGTSDNYTADADGVITFRLKHHERVQITVPAGKRIVVTETEYGDYEPRYQITHGEDEPGNRVSGTSTDSILMNGDKTVDFINSKAVELVAPTGITTRNTPYYLMMIVGFLLILLLGGSGFIKKKDRKNLAKRDVDADNQSCPRDMPYQTDPPEKWKMAEDSNAEAGDHIRWRNSVWNGRGYKPSTTRTGANIYDIPCPRAAMWFNSPTGDTPRLRGDPGGREEEEAGVIPADERQTLQIQRIKENVNNERSQLFMKKLISILTAIILLMAVCGVAMADPAALSNGIVGTNAGTALDRSVNIAKTIKVFNPDTLTVNGPTISYSYSIEAVTGGASNGKIITDADGVQATTQTPPDTMPTLFGTSANTIAWTTADQLSASSSGVDSTKYLTVNFSDVTFSAYGVYRYKITEICAAAAYTAAGVTDGTISNIRYLDVYVREPQGAETACQIYGYVLLTHDNSVDGQAGASTNTVTNAVKTTGFVAAVDSDGSTALTSDEYHTSNVTISKTLNGDSLMNSHGFPFHVAFANTDVTANVSLKRQVGNAAATDMTAGRLSSTTDYQTIANGGSVKYIGIPAGTTVSAYETNDVTGTTYESFATVTTSGTNATSKNISWGSAQGVYTTYSEQAYNSNLASIETTTTSTNFTEPFVNNLVLISPTGYVSRYAPYALILAAGVVLLIVAKKHKKNTDED